MKDIKEFEGMTNLTEIEDQIKICKTFCVDHRARRGWHMEILNQLHPDKIEYKVSDIIQQTPTSKTFRLAPTNGYVPPFRPGQFINIDMEINGIKTSRAYTLSSPPTQRAYYEITIKKVPDGFASIHMLNDIKVGDTITSSGPSGSFYRIPCVHGKRLVFIAGGSGITPFMSMLQNDFEKLTKDFDIDLIYGCSTENDIIFKDQLDALAKKGLCRVHYVISNPTSDCSYYTGFITSQLIKKIAGDPLTCTFYMCGPNVMYQFVTEELDKLGVPRRSIRKEVTGVPKDPTKFPGWPENINSNTYFTIDLLDGRSIKACSTTTILESLEKAGIVVPNLCRSGECSACRARLMDGNIFHPGAEMLRKSDMRFGYIHPCVTYPISNISLLL